MKRPRFGLFERFGVELEYMIVDADTLRIRPESDRLIHRVSGSFDGDVSRGALEWSNELALHLIELKTGKPVRRLHGLAEAFQSEVRHINRLLAADNALLLPTAMHPWMRPHAESRLWPHSYGEVYAAFDRIFNCSGHGWTNLQSTHLNLPFRTAGEFRRLHTAIRLLLPILPALAASSPFVEGRRAPFLDMRLETYRHNCRRIPSITGRVIPEPVQSPAEYRRRILQRIHRDLAAHDPERVLESEWTNARGAIARFERNTIEIRVLDIQECPQADLALAQLIAAVLKRLTDETWSAIEDQLRPPTASLERVLLQCARDGRSVSLRPGTYLRAFGLHSRRPMSVAEVWHHLLESSAPHRADWRPVIEGLLEEGSLSERILKAAGHRPGRRALRGVYRRLADCLHQGVLFHA
ncbi:MAG: glutamate-cysteine ligase family protein [Verrucomicrobia bacterium]|jgi:gamma-glutamyl:cysteine ligase YbdK (ATP-grasp superfamily)|nr:glutamate-cysteine ligase family protein [Verrucomicrobiota bacterium]